MIFISFGLGALSGWILASIHASVSEKRQHEIDRQMAQHDPAVAEKLALFLMGNTMQDARAARLRYYARMYRELEQAKKVAEQST